MEYYNDILCVSHNELINTITNSQLIRYSRDGKAQRVRRACKGTCALYAVDSLPPKYRDVIKQKYDIPDKVKETTVDLLSHVETDAAALKFFKDYRYRDGRDIDAAKQVEYANNAALFNAMSAWIKINTEARARHRRKRLQDSYIFEKFANALPCVCDIWRHSLPEHPRRLKEKYIEYVMKGYSTLVKQTNADSKHALKVNESVEKMILSIYSMKNKPFARSIAEIYSMFLIGQIEIADKSTGELFDRADFMRNGELIAISDSTVWNWLNKPKNRRLVDKQRNDMLYNKKVHEPYQQRESPQHSLSKITMDDRDLVRKTTNGESVKAYYSYDVASGACIGASYSLKKDINLVWDCFRDMFKFLERNNLGNPIECEVEHHLMNTIVEEMEAMFPYVTFCNPANSRQKRAEHLNRAKKYSAEKDLGQPTGRHYSRHEAYLSKSERDGAELKELKLPYERLVAEDLEAIMLYNNSEHPDRAKYPDMTRMEVLIHKQNPNITAIDKANIYKYIGKKTKTSLRNTKYCNVQYASYCLPTPQLIDKLKPNNYECEAYWLPNDDGSIESIYLYQGNKFIAECKKVTKYQEAIAEQTESDKAAIAEQSKYDAKYRKMLSDGKEDKIVPVAIIENEKIKVLADIPVEMIAQAQEEQVIAFDAFDFGDIKQDAVGSL
jgi:hypothetical protein